MSSFTKKKYVTEEVLNTYDLPTNKQSIVKIVKSRGNNLHEVINPEGETFLVSMPNKFRKHVWIKRGDFVIIDPITEGVKVKGEIVRVLLKDQIKYFHSQNIWPKAFSDAVPQRTQRDTSNNSDELFVNTNSPYVNLSMSSDSEESCESEASSASDSEEDDCR